MSTSKRLCSAALPAAVVALLPAAALAHPGADGGAHHASFLAGLCHPFSGLDHVAAMLTVGLWSAATSRRALVAPAAFATALALGAVAGLLGLTAPGVEPLVAASVAVVGLLLALRVALAPWTGAAVAAALAIFHGLAHGSELAGAPSAAAALAGMVLGTLALHGAGLAVGTQLRTRSTAATLVGAGVTAVGLGLALA